MNDITQLKELLTQQIAAQADKLLAEARPKVLDTVRAEVMPSVQELIETRVSEQMATLRTAAEDAARAAILEGLSGTVTKPTSTQIRVPKKPLTPTMVQHILTQSLDPITAALGIRQIGKRWCCAFCTMPFNTQRAASMHARKCAKRSETLAGAAATPIVAPEKGVTKKARTKKTGTKNPKRTCIKPGCTKPSRGPRFHHLCEGHKATPLRQVRAWQRKLRDTAVE